MKKKSRKKFQPLVHENLDIKNELLQLARNAKTTQERKLEGDLASVLIYSNIAEYLAENLLENLNHFVYQKTYEGFGGILYIESVSKSRSRTLYQMVEEIEKFCFPDKENILSCFKNIAESRNKLFHSFAKSDIETITNLLNDDLPVIQDECEEAILKINTIYSGLRKITENKTKERGSSDDNEEL